MTIESISSAIRSMGRTLGPEVLAACHDLFDSEQRALMVGEPATLVDAPYGEDPRHRLDLYGGTASGDQRPVLLFVHGGGFRMGDKGDNGRWANAAVGRMAARRGMLGAVINYRLAPDHGWPAGGADVLAALDWLSAHAADHGGDPRRIILMGTSAGAVHVATALHLRPTLAARGLILLSGLYGYTDLDAKDLPYYGDPALYPQRMPRAAVETTLLPLMLAVAEMDPPRFQQEFAGLLAARLAQHGALPRLHHGDGHNHYSLAMHLGTADDRLADAIADFVAHICA